MAEIIKGSSARGKELINRAAHNMGDNLYNVYGSFSKEKANAMDACKDMCSIDFGENFRIISFCRNNFSVAWEMNWDGHPATRIQTYASDYVILLDS